MIEVGAILPQDAKMRNLFFYLNLCMMPSLVLAEEGFTPAQPLETNPLTQQFTPHTANSNTALYVTQFATPGVSQPTNNLSTTQSLTNIDAWVNSPGQMLTNNVLNRYGVGVQVGF